MILGYFLLTTQVGFCSASGKHPGNCYGTVFSRLELSGFPGLTLEDRNELKIRMESEFRQILAKYLADKCFP